MYYNYSNSVLTCQEKISKYIDYSKQASLEDALVKLEYDLYYIKNMSILLDIKIILKTIGVVIFGQGAR